MSNTLTLPKNVVEYLLYGDSASIAYGYTEVDKVIGDEWRWGYWWTLVIKDKEENYWAIDYQLQTGDNYWNSLEGYLENHDEAEFYRVVPEEIIKIVYLAVKDAS